MTKYYVIPVRKLREYVIILNYIFDRLQNVAQTFEKTRCKLRRVTASAKCVPVQIFS